MGPADPSFWQIKIIILISHINNFFHYSFYFWYDLFNWKKSSKKGNEALYCTVFILNWQTKHSTGFFTQMINVFIFRCADPQVLLLFFQLKMILLNAHTTKNLFSPHLCFMLKENVKKF